MNIDLEPKENDFEPEQKKEPEQEIKPEENFSKSKNMELAPLKDSKDNNTLSPDPHPAQTQGSTMWKKKPGNESKVASGSTANVQMQKDSKLHRYYHLARSKVSKFLDNYYVVGWMTLITLYALLGDDIRVLSTDKDGDPYFFGMASVCLGFFGTEIILSSFSKDGYFLGFFFWLDLLSTASLIFDIQWITDSLFGTGGAQSAQNATSLARASRASRIGTRAGRIVRIVRLIRLVKLYKHAQQVLLEKNAPIIDEDEKERGATTVVMDRRDSKLNTGSYEKRETKKKENTVVGNSNANASISNFNAQPVNSNNNLPGSNPQQNNNSNSNNLDNVHDSNEIKQNVKGLKKQLTNNEGNNISKSKEFAEKSSGKFGTSTNANPNIKEALINNIPQETNVGKKLSDLTTKRVIMLVMSIMLSIPVFSLDTYTEEYTSYESGLRTIYYWSANQTSSPYKISVDTYISENTNSDQRNPLILLTLGDSEIYRSPTVMAENLRDEEQTFYTYAVDGVTLVVAVYDGRADTSLDAALGIGRTIFVCVVLTLGALYFSKDAHELVLHPIENMLEKVKRIAKNPLEAAQMEENEALAIEEVNKKANNNKKDKKKEEATYETTILEKTIIKIGALLALGFGEAGSEIIAQNMSKSGEVDPMIPGKKIMAIFGFCDIRNFTDATEILQEDVMVFVNEIAEIVHTLVDHFSGAANKNIGDAFLLVWKFPENEVKSDPNNPSNLVLSESRPVKQIADMSVIAFLKIVAGINLSKKLKKYKEHKGLNERMPNYCVRMGFGLHVGWAIEGAIGSEFKIDASYLSPNVNMASRLEAATKQFGVPILVSGALYKTMTDEAKKELRHIDRVTVKGSIEPMDLYTCDVDLQNLVQKVRTSHLDKLSSQKLTKAEKKKLKVYNRLRRNELKKKVLENKTTIANLFSSDKELRAMRETFPKEFYESFQQGLDKYFSGEWPECREILEKTHTMLPNIKDGPSNTLLEVIKEFGGKAPGNWMGYRELTEK